MTKLLVAKRFSAENKSAASHFHHAMKTESVKFVVIKAVVHTKELLTDNVFFYNWENVQARALYTRGVLVL